MPTDQKRRLLTGAAGGRAAGWSGGMRGGATQGPVGDLRNGPPAS